VRPVGGERELPIDTRILSATHHDLRRRIREGSFRADLFHRLAVLEVEVPPLRSRRGDLPLLVEKLAPRIERETGRGPLPRASLRADGGEIASRHLELRFTILEEAEGPRPSSEPLEKIMISTALKEAGGSVSKAARRIGWSRQKLYRRMRALAIG
jgi:DNA-binding NtrC family response regulator